MWLKLGYNNFRILFYDVNIGLTYLFGKQTTDHNLFTSFGSVRSNPAITKISFNVFILLAAMFKTLNQEVLSMAMTRVTVTPGR